MRIFLLFFLCFVWLFIVSPSVFAHENEKPFIIQITDTGFSPEVVSIPLNSKVIFENTGENAHWPASNLHPTHGIYPEFDPQKSILPGEKWEFVFSKVGTWNMHDHLYPEFYGEITVRDKIGEKSEEKDSYVEWQFSNMVDQIFWKGKIGIYQLYSFFFHTHLEKQFQEKNIFKIVESKDDLEFWLTVLGPKKVIDTLKITTGKGDNLQCHRHAHTVGRGAYILYGIESFRFGDSSCSSGFYHGVIEAYIREKGGDSMQKDLIAICITFSIPFEKYQCFHGGGHGILAYMNYDLPKAVEICRTLKDEDGKAPCLDGVFMENFVAAITVRKGTGDHTTTWLRDDFHYPCTLFDRYQFVQRQCYQMQTSWMLYLTNGNYEAVLAECSRAPKQAISSCYRSLGRDVGFAFFRDPEKILQYCNTLVNNAENYTACMKGGLFAILEYWGVYLKDQGEAYCQQVLAPGQKTCFDEVIKRKKTLTN